MNHRVSVSAALALGTLLTCSVTKAQAPPAPNPPDIQAQIDRMRAQIAGLQAEVERLQSGLAQTQPGVRKAAPLQPGPDPFAYRSLPELKSLPNFKSLPGQSLGNRLYVAPAPRRRYTNIPDFKVIPLGQPCASASRQ